MPHDHRFVTPIQTQYGIRFAATPEAIDAAWRQDRAVGESLIKQRAELMSVRTRDAMLPGAPKPPSKRKALVHDDPLPDTEELPNGRDDRILAELPAPPDGMRYLLEPQSDGSWAVVVEPGEPDSMSPLTGDGRRKDPRLVRANRDARAFWRGETHDASYTIFTCGPYGPGERLELQGPSEFGMYALVLTDDDGEPLTADYPLGASGTGEPLRSPGARPPETSRAGDSNWYGARTRQRDSAKLKMMNAAARKLWNPQGRVR